MAKKKPSGMRSSSSKVKSEINGGIKIHGNKNVIIIYTAEKDSAEIPQCVVKQGTEKRRNKIVDLVIVIVSLITAVIELINYFL